MLTPKPGVVISAYALPGLKGNYKFPIGVTVVDKAAQIEFLVSEYFGYTVNNMKLRNRSRNKVYARQISMFLMRRYTALTLKEIGKRFLLDHTSVVYACKHVQNLMETDEMIMHIVQSLETRVQ